MIHIEKLIFAFCILNMLFNLCRLNLISQSRSTLRINNDLSEGHEALRTFSKSFSRESFNNFSLFSLINQNGKTALFVVCRNDTIIQIEIESMEMVNIYRKNGCSYSLKFECEETTTINLLAEINLLNQKMMWFCYILPQNNFPSPSLTSCLVPKNNILPDDLRWTKMGFTSTSTFYRTYAVQAKPYIFIGSYVKNSLLILRTKLPNILGKIDSSEDLITPMAEFYFEKNSKFLEVFATQFEVYYIVVEPLNAKSHSISECLTSSDTRTVISTRLIRICKDDPGGVLQYNEQNFGTVAKSDIICPVGDGMEQYFYTRSISASWSGDKLYVLFESQKNSPPGKVLCVYDEFAFNVAFNSDMVPPKIFSNIDKTNHKIDNPIMDICKKLTEKSLSESERIEATSISANGLYRQKNIFPIREAPLLKLRNLSYHSMSTFKLSKIDPSILIILISDNSIRILSHMEDNNICYIQDFHFDKNETINQVKGDNIGEKVFVHISTNQRMIQLELLMCQKYLEKILCLSDAPGICGWDSRRNRCTLYTDAIDPARWQRSACKDIKVHDTWSLAEKCIIKNDEENTICSCRYCLEETGCLDGNRVEISNCSGTANVDTYGEWSSWSECSSPSQYQKRIRNCTARECNGPSVDYRKCSYSSTSVIQTNWTKWYPSNNNKYRVSFRGKCPKNKLLPPTIEEREMFCGEACSDESLKWTTWSDCIETNIYYRLLNCTSFESCPYTQTEVKVCQKTPGKYQQDEKENSYSIIHIVLAILIVSLVWLIILILVSICLFRYNFHYKKKSIRRMPRLDIPRERIPTNRFQPILFHQKSTFSETSNDYLCADIPSSSFNPTNNSLISTIDSDHAHNSSTNIYSRIPLMADKHSVVFNH